MPRVSPSIMLRAFKIHPCLPLLLPECRTIQNAKQEFNWIYSELINQSITGKKLKKLLKIACVQRYHHYPLQYILKTQPFGSLTIYCKKSVLIPRWETEEWVLDLVQSFKNSKVSIDSLTNTGEKFIIYDICTGTGCIPLLIRKELNNTLHNSKNVAITAVDCSIHAIQLTKYNQKMCNDEILDVHIQQFDVLKFDPALSLQKQKIDILLCNPPYIPKSAYVKEVSKSVKLFEPKLALIGNEEFYENLIKKWVANINSFVYEVGYEHQIILVKTLFSENSALANNWVIDAKYDSNKKPRVVYGYRKDDTKRGQIIQSIFNKFGELAKSEID